MFFRVRTSLTEKPGALARLATDCGDAGLNILGLQIFPSLGRATDELVLSAPESWTARAVAELVGGAGGDEVSVETCTTHDLLDQPTRWLTAAQDAVRDPGLVDGLLERLLGPHPEKWSATEHARAAALRGLAESPGRPPAPAASAPVEYAETLGGVVAHIGGHVVGAAALSQTGGRELTIEVAPAWRRLGIGTTLLRRSVGLAAAAGLPDILFIAPAQDEGFVTMVCSAGLHARIKVSQGILQARIRVADGGRPSRVPAGDPAGTHG